MMCMSVCISIESFCYTTTASELHSFLSFLQDGNDVQYYIVLTLIAVGTNETFDHYILQSNFL